MKTIRPGFRFPAALLLVAAAPALMAATTISLPAPGLYQIDSDATLSTAQGVQKTQHVDGATGTTTSQGRTYPGTGPNVFCVGRAVPPAWALAANQCRTLYAGSSVSGLPGGAMATNCGEGTKVDEAWQQIDATHWKRHVHGEVAAPVATQWPEATRKAMEPVIAQLEAQAKTGSADEKESARQQLDALRGQTGAAPMMVTDTDETWTLVSATCPAK